MQPFRVQCETCQTAFRVRDERVVGQIHACPKCGGMVMLNPPEGSAQPGATAEAEPPVETEPPVEAPESRPTLVIEPAAARSPAEAFGRVVAVSVAVGGLVFVAAATVVTLALRSPPAPDLAQQAADTAVANPGDVPPDVADPDVTDTGLGEPAPGNPGSDNTVASYTAAGDPGADNGAADDAGAEAPLAPTPANQPEANQPAGRTDPATPAEPAPEPALPRTPPLPAATDPPRQSQEQGGPQPASDPALGAAGPIDPLDFDPASADLILTRRPRQEPAPAAPSAAVPTPNASLDRRLASRHGVDERGVPADNALDRGLAARALGVKAWARIGDTSKTPAATPAEEALRVTVPRIELTAWPLERVLDLLGKLGGAPITMRPSAARRAGVAVDRPIDLAASDKTIAQLLEATLRPLSLACIDRGGSLVVARRDADQQHEAGYAVDDLVDGRPEQLRSLARAVLALDRPGAELRLEEGRFRLAAPRSDHYELLVFCERLRKARGLPRRSKYPDNLLATRPARELLAERLNRRARFTFVADTPLSRVVDHWREGLGAPMLVDWEGLAAAGLTPLTPVAGAAREATWEEALDAVLPPLGLTWRAADAGVLEITTPRRAEPAVEFHPAASRGEADELSRTLAGVEAARHDPLSRSLIVRRRNAPQQRRR